MTRLVITLTRTAIVLVLLVGGYHWVAYRDWLLLALGAWATAGLLVLISIDRRDPGDEP